MCRCRRKFLLFCGKLLGVLKSFCHACQGYFSPYPEPGNRESLRNCAKQPYSVWKGIFLGYVWELAAVRLGHDPPVWCGDLANRPDAAHLRGHDLQPWQASAPVAVGPVAQRHPGYPAYEASNMFTPYDPAKRPAAFDRYLHAGAKHTFAMSGLTPGGNDHCSVTAHGGALLAPNGAAPANQVRPVPLGAVAPAASQYSLPLAYDVPSFTVPACDVRVGEAAIEPAAVTDSPAERFGITRSVLQQAGKETRDRLTSELTVMMSVCTFIGGFMFTTLVSRSGIDAADVTPARSTYQVFAGVTVILALTCVGVYARLLVLFQWSATSTSLYRTICRWERAMSGNQLVFYAIINTSLAAALTACWEYPAASHWVFVVLGTAAFVAMVLFTYFWSESMWCRTHGIMHHHTKLFHARLLGTPAAAVYHATGWLSQRVAGEATG